MRTAGLFALGLLAAAPSYAQDDPAGGRHQIAPDNNWSINDLDCMIDASWDGDIAIVVNRHFDHHDLGVYDPAFKGLAAGKVIDVRLGTTGDIDGSREYRALGYRDGKLKSYVAEIDDDMLNQFAVTNLFQFYRDGRLLTELDMTGFRGALEGMHACEARQGKAKFEDSPATEDAMSTSAAEAAMDAANAAAEAATKP